MHSTTQCHALVLGTTGTTYIRQQQKYIGREKYEIHKNKNKNKNKIIIRKQILLPSDYFPPNGFPVVKDIGVFIVFLVFG